MVKLHEIVYKSPGKLPFHELRIIIEDTCIDPSSTTQLEIPFATEAKSLQQIEPTIIPTVEPITGQQVTTPIDSRNMTTVILMTTSQLKQTAQSISKYSSTLSSYSSINLPSNVY